MAMNTVTATATAWTEAPRDVSASVVLQNQGYGDVYVHIAASAPGSLEAPGLILSRLEEKTFRDFTTGHKLFVKARSDECVILIWR